jgi:excisionase family DNA binding protein
MLVGYMMDNHILKDQNGEERRKHAERRSGFDRRARVHSNGIEEENGNEIVFTTKQACDYLQISRPTYLKYIAAGKIKAMKIGRGWKIHKSELDRFLRGK